MRFVNPLCALGLACVLSTAAQAQDTGTLAPFNGNPGGFDTSVGSLEDTEGALTLEELQRLPQGGAMSDLEGITTETQDKVARAAGARLRALDKLTGRVSDLDVSAGGTVDFGRLAVTLDQCRYPEGNPAGNAYAYLHIEAQGMETAAFDGWMIASAPALNAMDHPRYDVWVLSCKTS
ncbi:hypothetical protein AQS8620_02536 [Aquimixticola soesokkakensis]|uniref:DUF2155 domain-containing protein n=1 Tax=Aquimixticola soesokkakensis TaxID=1519096 RepID=A0A1Y5TA92_9RHOB|nr:DUF2155 domain-containing protein [Aquimixticola soesokkakensis]SLN57407.1 hypothetical protein AQS8620_02536 [Aquimixticola soesokkakensis]